jgi:hypothetical protein
LRSKDRRAHQVAILANLPEVPVLGLTQRSHGPIVDHQRVYAAEPGQKTAGCRRRGPSSGLGTATGRVCTGPSNRRGRLFAPGRKPQSSCLHRLVPTQIRSRCCPTHADSWASARITFLSGPRAPR